MSDEQPNNPTALIKKPRVKKLPTGRPRGRPPKRDEFLVASQLRRTLLEVLAEEIDAPGLTGVRKITKFRAVMENLVSAGAKGKPTALNHLMRLIPLALAEREEAHPQVRIGEWLRVQSEAPSPMTEVSYKDVRVQMNYAKEKY